MSFDYAAHTAAKTEAPRWTGFPEYNFVGGHNDEASVPVDALRAAADAVLSREGSTLGTYYLQSGPQGYRPLREYIAAKQKKYAGMEIDPDNILITSGSLQALDLVNEALVAPGDTVVVEQATYGGMVSRLQRAGAEIVGARQRDDHRFDRVAAVVDDGAADARVLDFAEVVAGRIDATGEGDGADLVVGGVGTAGTTDRFLAVGVAGGLGLGHRVRAGEEVVEGVGAAGGCRGGE